MSVHKWGESPLGHWTLLVETREPQNRESRKSAKENEEGVINYFGLRLYGTHGSEKANETITKRHETTAFIPSATELEQLYHRELSRREFSNVMKKRHYQNLLDKRENSKETQDQSILSSFLRKFNF